MSLAGQGEQAELSHKQMSGLTIKQTEVISFFLNFLSSPMQHGKMLVRQEKTVACHSLLISCFLMRENSLPSSCQDTEVTKQSWLLQILGLQGRQGEESRTFTDITPLLIKGCEGEDEELAYTNIRIDWGRTKMLLLRPVHSNLQN